MSDFVPAPTVYDRYCPMIYTCYEMVRDCRENRAAGWSYLITNYVPVIRKILAHYQAPPELTIERMLSILKDPSSSLFASVEPAPERHFLADLRQKIAAELTAAPAAISLDLETVAAALEPFTMVERQVAWLQTMHYSDDDTGALLRMAPATVEKIRVRAADLLRGKQDSWSRTILPDNGLALGREAAAASGPECFKPKPFLDMIDGRTSWSGRGELERHAIRCWHCIDHFCRLLEVVGLLRGNQPLSDAEAEPFRKLLAVQTEKAPMWKRWLG